VNTPISLRARAAIGGVVGGVAFIADVFRSGLRAITNPLVSERVSSDGVVAMVVFLPVWIIVGAVIGMSTAIRPFLLRNLLIGATIGATVWTYLTSTWSVTARGSALTPPTLDVPGSIATGAVLGALGGLFLWVAGRLRRYRSDAPAQG